MASTTENTPFPTSASAGAGAATASSNASNAAVSRPSAEEVVNRVARSAHDVVDRVAGAAMPAVERVRSGFNDARGVVKQRAGDLSVMQDEWVGQCRESVRERPLTAVAIGVVAGMLLSKLLSR